MKRSVTALFEASFKKNFLRPALSDYHGMTLTYGELAERIAQMHLFFDAAGIKPGDKIALCSKNQANWCVAYLGIMTYGAVVVPLLHEFKPSSIVSLVKHCDAKMLFIGDYLWENMDPSEFEGIQAIVTLSNFNVVYGAKESYKSFREHVESIFKSKYPSFGPDDVKYRRDSPEDLALISYTSGSTGFSKGVMLPYRSVIYNIEFAFGVEPEINENSSVISMLPSAHMYGMQFEFLFEICAGAHIYFLTRLPSPKIITTAMQDIKPHLIVTVPMILEKIYKSMLLPYISRGGIKMFLSLPGINQMILQKIRQSLIDAFGGQFKEVLVGGAALNREVEAFLKRINFPFTVGYGMTECGPIITYVRWDKTRLYSCGKAAPHISVKIDSPDPHNVPGEILVKGENTFLGYYKNNEATERTLEKGWVHTGDLGIIDKDGYVFIKGRSKNMILGPSGQNIYPEEIESSINNLPYVGESLVVMNKGRMTALIHPDYDGLREDGISDENDVLLDIFGKEMKITNMELPSYSQISDIVIMPEEFEKTPKRSIKRFLYQKEQ